LSQFTLFLCNLRHVRPTCCTSFQIHDAIYVHYCVLMKHTHCTSKDTDDDLIINMQNFGLHFDFQALY